MQQIDGITLARKWEDIFSGWAKPLSETEKTKCDNAVVAIEQAIKQSSELKNRGISVLTQGSYHNRTNVREDSDVDIRVVYSGSIFFDLPNGMTLADFGISTPAIYPFGQFKNDVENSLTAHFRNSSVKRGNKAFDITSNTFRVEADVVAGFEYRQYDVDKSFVKGVSFLTDQGKRIVNFPDQNYENGINKNSETNRRFKATVRILKKLRNEMEDNGVEIAKHISSFLIECLLWNVPNEGFGHDLIVNDVRWAIAHLFNQTRSINNCKEWKEVNELKCLFHDSQPWTMTQANNFLNAAWNYIGFD